MRSLPAEASLYLHIPFCNSICPFCDFTKFNSNQSIYQRYVDACCHELRAYSYDPPVELVSIFFGGGTPSCLPSLYLKQLIDCIRDVFDCSLTKEITIEMNPEDVSVSYLNQLNTLGFTRISLGVQTFDEQECTFLGRGHTVKQSHQALKHITLLPFDLNIDLMFGLPHSSIQTLSYSLEQALAYEPNHISTYSLTIEPGTLFYKNNVQKASNDADFQSYSFLIDFLSEHSFKHYEVSSFAKAQSECIHNKRYWQFDPYIGIGVGAHSFIAPYRYQNPVSLNQYLNSPIASYFKSNFQPLSHDALIKEHIIANLRTPNGIVFNEYKIRYNIDFHALYQHEIKDLMDKNLIIKTDIGIQTTKKGLYLLDNVCLSFL